MGYRLIFAYDARGNLTDVTDQDNATTHYDYDADSRMTAVTNPFDETTGYEYSPGGRVETRLLANGCVTYYGYDEAGQVSLVDNRTPDLSVISSFAYERDSRGNPTKITREDGSVVEYGYDAKGQLTSEVHKDPLGTTTDAWEWDYDLCGNRTYQIFNGVRTDYTYNAANQLTQETTGGVTTHYAYDRCGNTKSKQGPEGTTGYRWDHENRLTQIDQSGDVHSYFGYDADGKRVTKEDSEGFTRFIYQGPDMLALLQERDENGDLLAHYTIGDGLEAMRRGDDSRFYHYDWLGSTFELTDGDGAVTDSYLYDAWGNALATTGATPNPYRYVGKLRYYEMPGAGLCQLGNRQYRPALGQFLTPDPAKAGVNWRLYALARPATMADPLGLRPKDGYIPPSRSDYWVWPTRPYPTPEEMYVKGILALSDPRYGKDAVTSEDRDSLHDVDVRIVGGFATGLTDAADLLLRWRLQLGGVMSLNKPGLTDAHTTRMERLAAVPEVAQEIGQAFNAARERARSVKGNHFWLATPVKRGPGITTDLNWNKAIGGYQYAVLAEVFAIGNRRYITFTHWLLDWYHFDYFLSGKLDPDPHGSDVPAYGHLHRARKAKDYVTVGKVEWTAPLD